LGLVALSNGTGCAASSEDERDEQAEQREVTTTRQAALTRICWGGAGWIHEHECTIFSEDPVPPYPLP
jgi:hypothetical protein